jgi:alpha-L-arabinofuranosidase
LAIDFISISGNEDNFQAGSYAAYRWPMIVDQLSARFPNLEFLATTLPSTALQPKYKKSKVT